MFRLWRCLFMERHILAMGTVFFIPGKCCLQPVPPWKKNKRNCISKLEIKWASAKYFMCVYKYNINNYKFKGPSGPNFKVEALWAY